METRIQRIFLKTISLVVLSMMSAFSNADELENEQVDSVNDIKIFEPQVERREVDKDAIDSENWELGIHYGIISIEDFGSSSITSFSAAYHISSDFFLSLNYGETEAGLSSFESLSGLRLIPIDESREYIHYNVALGFNVLPGEGFFGKDTAFTSNFYLLAGVGSTNFAKEKQSTLVVGGGYQVLFNDWFAMHLLVKDNLYDTDLLATAKVAHDLEISTGFTVFF